MTAGAESGSRAPVLVTGGTGFLGTALVRSLAQRGAEAHVLARASSDRGALAELGVVWHTGDLLEPDSVERAVRAVAERARAAGTTARLVHSAALISYRTGDRERSHAVNVGGTETVLAAARRHRIGRVLHVSSVVTIGHSVGGEALDETAPYNNAGLGVAYADTKRAAEELALAAARDLDVVVVNPGAIFGPIARASNTARFIARVIGGKSPILAPPGGIGVVGIEDVATGTLAALDRGRRGERYILVESNIALLELIAKVARAAGTRPTRWACPRILWPLAVAGARVVDRIRPLRLAPPEGLVMLGRALRFDSRKARAELGWRPRPFDEVLAETIEHVRRRPPA